MEGGWIQFNSIDWALTLIVHQETVNLLHDFLVWRKIPCGEFVSADALEEERIVPSDSEDVVDHPVDRRRSFKQISTTLHLNQYICVPFAYTNLWRH